MHKLVLLRHGESIWNQQNIFTGWTDVPLSSGEEGGEAEARKAAELLKAEHFVFDLAFTSMLQRAIKTLWIVLEGLEQMWLPTKFAWQLNERHYGALQGLNKAETAEKYGAEQVHIWRRSFDTPPPLIKPENEYYPGNDPRYSPLAQSELPLGESLKDTVQRVIPFWQTEIVPCLQDNKRLILSAHGNSLRALVKHLDHISDQNISRLNIPTGIPLIYELDENLKPREYYYLGEPKTTQKAAEKTTGQFK